MNGPKPPVRRHRRHLSALEGLEARVLLSGDPPIYRVPDTSDSPTGPGSLRYAILRANADTTPAGSRIRFDPVIFSSPRTITLSGELELSETAGPEVID